MDAKQTPLIELLERVPADASPDPLHLSRILHELAGAASLCWTPHPSGVFDSQEAIKHVESAIAEIRDRLAQQVQEPVAWMVYTLDGKSVCVTDNPNDFSEEHRALALYTIPPRPEQDDEPATCWKCGEDGGTSCGIEACGLIEAQPEQEQEPVAWCPDVCPITGLLFFMWIDHHETGQKVPTYGGPYDSYTIPVRDKDGSYYRERYDHDLGGWLTDEVEGVGVQIVSDQAYVSDEPPASKPWVGLTDEEMVDLQDRCGISIHQSDFEAIEAKLKEKNT